jgi:bifunctional non-homologous end joining protein LigD
MSLTTYRKKRDFRKTAEPAGASAAARSKRAPKAKALSYLIQKHDATRLHYDFRLELDGVLKSWAVPKGPSLNPADKNLAVEVEDHPLEYGTFEGTIPQGEYGGGTVMLWDRGTWEPVGDPHAGLKAGKLTFTLHGERLRGEWALVRMRPRPGDSKNNWLLLKHTDDHASTTLDPREQFTTSVATGRTLDAIAKAGGQTVKDRSGTKKKPVVIGAKPRQPARNPAPAAKPVPGSKRTTKRSSKSSFTIDLPPQAVAAAMPRTLAPQLATLVDAPPAGSQWIHEVKFDGYRILIFLDHGTVRLISRNDNDWTHRFAPVTDFAATIPVESAIIDGEAVALNTHGRSDFQALQNAMRAGAKATLAYYAFDLVHLNGADFRAVPLLERKRILKAVLDSAGVTAETPIRYSDHISGDGGEVAASACRLGLEGIISKLADAPYRSKRTTDWLKIKCALRQEFVIGGFTEPRRSRPDLGALLLGHYHDGTLHYAGKVGTGFTEATLREMRTRLNALETKTAPFIDPPRGADAAGVHWVKPTLVGEVRFTGWTSDGHLRHPAFEGLRFDKPAKDVIRETPKHLVSGRRAADEADAQAPAEADPPRGRRAATAEPDVPAKVSKRAPRRGDTASATVAGVRISNPDRVVYPDAPGGPVTKQQVAEYYAAAGERLAPHLLNRAVSIVRCPTGVNGQKFYQKNLHAGMPAGLASVHVKLRSTEGDFIVCDDLADVIGLVQMGVLEFHPWASTAEDLEHPDRVVFDLDPGTDVGWDGVIDAARLVRTMLTKVGLTPFLKTTGGKGLHVVAPLTPKAGWDEVKAFSLAVAQTLAAADPNRYTTNMLKDKRSGRIFVDYLRNARGATSVAPYSTRARPGATVSMPITWAQLGTVDPAAFTVHTVPGILAKARSDPWKDFDDARVPLPSDAAKPVRSSRRGAQTRT